MTRRSHRSYVSYIDKSRNYYEAQGYERPYQWAVADDLAFTRPSKPLGDSRVGVVTTSFFPLGDEPEGVDPMSGHSVGRTKHPYAAAIGTAGRATFTHDLSWAKDETHTNDVASYLPVGQLVDAAAEGRIGSVSPRFYGVPTTYSQRITSQISSPQVERWMREDEVDLALLVGL